MDKDKRYYCIPHNYPKELIDIASRRIEDLLTKHRLSNIPISKLLESAYLIGAADGYQMGIIVKPQE